MNCAAERNRRGAGKRDSGPFGGGGSGGEPTAAFGSAGIHYCSSAAGSHANQKAVRAFALDDRGLKGAFGGHDQGSCLELVQRGDGGRSRSGKAWRGPVFAKLSSGSAAKAEAKSPLLEAIERDAVKPSAAASNVVHSQGHVVHRDRCKKKNVARKFGAQMRM
jgi:hypothetical protein